MGNIFIISDRTYFHKSKKPDGFCRSAGPTYLAAQNPSILPVGCLQGCIHRAAKGTRALKASMGIADILGYSTGTVPGVLGTLPGQRMPRSRYAY